MKIRSHPSFLHLLIMLFVASVQSAHVAAAGGTGPGIYKGSYSSDAPGGDYGAVTIIVDGQGNTACNFHSTPTNDERITVGGMVNSSSSHFALTCANAGISFGGGWMATTDSASIAGQSLSGTWKSVFGPSPPITGTFTATFVSGLSPIDPAAITGLWYQPGMHDGGFNFLFADQGLYVTYMGVTFWAVSFDGKPVGVPLGSPYWLISDVGPQTVLPGTAFSVNVFAPPNPPTTQVGPAQAEPQGSLKIVFFDCKLATATLTGSTFVPSNLSWNLHKLVGAANGPGC
ncbi:hypothetical protein [Rudaea sp.]|uniref:hypothetical protein n=1 Tax=Rudaea sp. TaxID=2136325 RepID=UPI002ED1AB79